MRSRFEALERELEETRAERDELLLANRELEAESVASVAVEPPEATAEARKPGAGGTGIDWSTIESLLAKSAGVLGKRFDQLGEEERAQIGWLHAELQKTSAKAKALTRHPLFDRQVFEELTRALFKGSLHLTDDQLSLLSRMNDAIFANLPEDIASLSSLDRSRLRMEMFDRLSKGMEEALEENQLREWLTVRDFAKNIFDDSGRLDIGVSGDDVNAASLMGNWLMNGLHFPGTPDGDHGPPGPPQLDPALLEQLSPAAENYLRLGKELLNRYLPEGANPGTLSPEARNEMDREFLDLQKRFMEQVMPLLNEEQRKDLTEGPPTMIRFKPGKETLGTIHPSLF